MNSKKLLPMSGLLFFSIFSFFVFAADLPTEDQIAKIVMTANTSEVEMADIAKEKAENREVKDFAKDMLKAHAKSNSKSMRVIKKIRLNPTDSEKSIAFKTESDVEIKELRNLSGSDFDKVYMNKQVSLHERVLSDLDTTLIPAAKNKQLKKLLNKTRTDVAQHLEDARKIRATLK